MRPISCRLEPRFTSSRSGMSATPGRMTATDVAPVTSLSCGARRTRDTGTSYGLELMSREPSIVPLGVLDPALVVMAHGKNGGMGPRMDLGFVRNVDGHRRQLDSLMPYLARGIR